MNRQTATQTLQQKSIATPTAGGVLQRKCNCGNHTMAGGECVECSKKKETLQRASLSPRGRGTEGEGEVPPIVHEVLRSPGQPLDPATRAFFEPRFGHDFSQVRVHTDAKAAVSAEAVNALAYTVGHEIMFGTGHFTSGTDSGRRLLAHELAHVVQQGARAPSGEILIGPVGSPEEVEADRIANSLPMAPGQGEPLLPSAGAMPMLRAQPKKKAPPKKQKPKVLKICGRPSRKVPGNSITKVNLDVGANTLTIEWADKTKIPPGSAGTHNISPGAGRCCVDCNDAKVSQTSRSLCTPKGGSWPVDYTGCKLPGFPSAKNPTYFQRGGVAIHSGNTSSPPQSHGCARTSVEISELIRDNAVREQTKIASSGTWTSEKCYLTAASEKLSARKDVCDGNKLKSKKKGKKAARPKQKVKPKASEPPMEQTPKPARPPSQVPVAEALSVESDELATVEELEPGAEGLPEMIADGPGPNNEPLSHESIGEVVVADLDLVEETGEGGDIEEEAAAV